jgi:hypothetical protein
LLLLAEQLAVMGCWMLLEARDPPLVGLEVCLALASLFPAVALVSFEF